MGVGVRVHTQYIGLIYHSSDHLFSSGLHLLSSMSINEVKKLSRKT